MDFAILLVIVIAIAGGISTIYILGKRGHSKNDGLTLLALLCWPVALLISLSIPVEKPDDNGDLYDDSGKRIKWPPGA
jgi:hypothetical protein